MVVDNPYIGPRTFRRADRDLYFGREQEARELLSLVISERLVLFYAQSGAGKSSLINTRLIPQLQEENFSVLPVTRVSGTVPLAEEYPKNIFAYNLMRGLDQGPDDPQRLAQLSLTEFLARLVSPDGETYYCSPHPIVEEEDDYESGPYVLIIDQFEELITAYPGCWDEREAFFCQLQEAMVADPHLWIVIALREDYVAALDPYAHIMPNHLRARFYLQRPDIASALAAIKKPADLGGRPFAPGVAETLVDNLRQIRMPGCPDPQPGQFVEPVQLQVVCYQLWENLRPQPAGQIRQDDLPLDYISQALQQFYETVIRKVARQTADSEVALREWFQTELITEAGTRGTVYRGEKRAGSVTNQAADLLVKYYLLRVEIRGGGTWYELTHDRFIEPIHKSNAGWQIGRLKRWTGTSVGFSSFFLIALLLTLIYRYFSPEEE